MRTRRPVAVRAQATRPSPLRTALRIRTARSDGSRGATGLTPASAAVPPGSAAVRRSAGVPPEVAQRPWAEHEDIHECPDHAEEQRVEQPRDRQEQEDRAHDPPHRPESDLTSRESPALSWARRRGLRARRRGLRARRRGLRARRGEQRARRGGLRARRGELRRSERWGAWGRREPVPAGRRELRRRGCRELGPRCAGWCHGLVTQPAPRRVRGEHLPADAMDRRSAGLGCLVGCGHAMLIGAVRGWLEPAGVLPSPWTLNASSCGSTGRPGGQLVRSRARCSKALMNRSQSSTVCWTDSVHSSSRPGVMKTPRLRL